MKTRIEPELKDKAEGILKAIGMTTTQAIALYYQQIWLNKGIPFDVRVPNKETLDSIMKSERGEGLHRHESVADSLNRIACCHCLPQEQLLRHFLLSPFNRKLCIVLFCSVFQFYSLKSKRYRSIMTGVEVGLVPLFLFLEANQSKKGVLSHDQDRRS